jgi:hypothetical protein
MAVQSKEHDSAQERLSGALIDEQRLTKRYRAAVGTSAELSANVQVHAAHELVVARGAWLKWVDDDGYRGLNAGPFALRSEITDG